MATVQDVLCKHVAAGGVPGAIAALGYADDGSEVGVAGDEIGVAGDFARDAIVRIQSMTKAVGWSGGLGTDVFVDPSAGFGVVLAQVEMGPAISHLREDFQGLLR